MCAICFGIGAHGWASLHLQQGVPKDRRRCAPLEPHHSVQSSCRQQEVRLTEG